MLRYSHKETGYCLWMYLCITLVRLLSKQFGSNDDNEPNFEKHLILIFKEILIFLYSLSVETAKTSHQLAVAQ